MSNEPAGAERPGVIAEVQAGVLRVVIDRPARMNSVTTATLNAIAEAFEAGARPGGPRVAVLTGAGKAFCTGADLSAIGDLSEPPTPATIDAANRAVAAIRAFPRPVVCAVNGPAAGVGVSLALAGDLTVATESSYLLLAFAKIGLMPDGGATALVAASIGRARAMRMALLAERMPAAEALAAGLIADVLPDADFAAGIEALVAGLAAGPAEALGVTKLAINDATLTELDAALRRERAGQLGLLAAEDFAEGLAAFLGKRPADFGER